MNRAIRSMFVVTAALLVIAPAAWSADLVEGPSRVAVRDVVIKEGTVTGVIVNNSDLLVRNPRILIRHAWLWENEFKPGTDNPGRSEIITIPAEIPAGESFAFSHNFPLTRVGDQRGRFLTSGQVVGFDEVGRPSISGLR